MILTSTDTSTDTLTDTFSVDTTSFYTTNPPYGNITISNNTTSPYYYNTLNNYQNTVWTTSPTITNGSSGLTVNGDAEFEGNVKIKGRDVLAFLEKIEDRLAILQEPDPEKLKKFAALKKAYDNYKLLEKLIGDYSEDDADK